MQKKPVFKRLVAICHIEAVSLCQVYSHIEIICRKIILVKYDPALIIYSSFLFVRLPNTDCLIDKADCIHGLTYCPHRRSCEPERIEIIRLRTFSFADNQKDCLISLNPCRRTKLFEECLFASTFLIIICSSQKLFPFPQL